MMEKQTNLKGFSLQAVRNVNSINLALEKHSFGGRLFAASEQLTWASSPGWSLPGSRHVSLQGA